jgi:hypothetical protein
LPSNDKFKVFSDKIARLPKASQKEALQSQEKQVKLLAKKLELMKIKIEITQFYVSANALQDQHAGVNYLISTFHNIYRDRMIRDQEHLIAHIIGFGSTATSRTPSGPVSSGGGSVASDDSTFVDNAETNSVVSDIDASVRTSSNDQVFGIAGEEVRDEDFDLDELENVDLSFYKS